MITDRRQPDSQQFGEWLRPVFRSGSGVLTLRCLISLISVCASSFVLSLSPVLAADEPPTTTTKTGPTACDVDIFYTWQPTPQSAPVKQYINGIAPTPSTTPLPPGEPQEIFFERQTVRGENEEQVHPRLKAAALEAERRARSHCERRHQSQSSCFAQGLQSRSNELTRLDFESRRIFREKLVEDCAAAFGICLATRMGDPACRPDESATTAPTSAPADDTKKKK